MSNQKNMLEEKKKLEEEKDVEKKKIDIKDLYNRFKTDKKFHAKVELIGYGVFILVIIVFVNFANTGSDNSYTTNTISENNINEENNTDNVNGAEDLFSTLTYNYEVNLEVDVVKDGVTSNFNYKVTSYDENGDISIIKNIGDRSEEYKLTNTGDYYKIEDEIKGTNEDEIFDLVAYKYLNLDSIKKYISKGTSEYTTNYSNGDKLVSYKIFVKDILLGDNREEFITINVGTSVDVVTIYIDYTDLLKSDVIDTCNVKAIYTNIGKVEIPSDNTSNEE